MSIPALTRRVLPGRDRPESSDQNSGDSRRGLASSRVPDRRVLWISRSCPVACFEGSVVVGPPRRIRQHLVRFLNLPKEGDRTAKVRVDPLDQRPVIRPDQVGRRVGRNAQDVVVGVLSHPSTMPSVPCSRASLPMEVGGPIRTGSMRPGRCVGHRELAVRTAHLQHLSRVAGLPRSRLRRVRTRSDSSVGVPRANCAHTDAAQALFLPLGTRPPTEVGARALRFRRPARSDVARLRTFIPSKGACNDFPRPLQGR